MVTISYEDRIPALNPIHAHFWTPGYFCSALRSAGVLWWAQRDEDLAMGCPAFLITAISVLKAKAPDFYQGLVSWPSTRDFCKHSLSPSWKGSPECDQFIRISRKIRKKAACEQLGDGKLSKAWNALGLDLLQQVNKILNDMRKVARAVSLIAFRTAITSAIK